MSYNVEESLLIYIIFDLYDTLYFDVTIGDLEVIYSSLKVHGFRFDRESKALLIFLLNTLFFHTVRQRNLLPQVDDRLI